MVDVGRIITNLNYSRKILLPRPLEVHHEDIEELDKPGSLSELQKLLSKITDEHPFSETLYKGKYQFFLWEYLLPYQKPLGDIFRNSIAVCIAKPKSLSGLENSPTELTSQSSSQRFGGVPLVLKFESFLEDETLSYKHNCTALELVSSKYDLFPLHKGVGKKLMSMCCSSLSGNWKFPVIVICHGTDPKGDVYFGAFRYNNKETRLLIDYQGAVCNQDGLPLVTNLVESHLGCSSPYVPVQQSVIAHYDFLEYECSNECELRPILETNLSIECEWSSPSAILEPIPPECRAIVKILSKDGDDNSGAYRTTRELTQVEAFVCNGGEIDCAVFDDTLAPVTDIEEQIEALIEDSRNPMLNMEQSSVATTPQSNFDDVLMKQRRNLDFIDKLWLILKKANELDSVISALKYVYSNLAADFEFPPYIADSNQSRLACDIRNMKQRNLQYPDFSSILAAEYMGEIGIDKLRKDYSNILLSLELAPLSSFRKYLEPPLVYNSEDPLDYPSLLFQACKNLRKLQSVIELTIVCMKRLNLSKGVLTAVIRDALKHYEEKDFNRLHSFNFAISPTNARNLLYPMRPTVWEISILSTSNDEMKQSIHRYKTSASHEHIYAPKNYPHKLMLPNASYSYWKGSMLQTQVWQ